MILDTLTLRNIGTFRDGVSLNLTPTPERPIILIGGHNGAGKTTILEAIQWLLYGSLVKTPRRDFGRRKYADYLNDLRHRNCDPHAEGTGRLEFRVRRDGSDVSVVVRRTIRPHNSRPERLEVWVNGEPLSRPEHEWPPLVDSILPQQLAPLHLFDGERIEQLADPEASRAFLRSGIHALLGIDLLDQLVVDLGHLRRKEAEAAAAGNAGDLEGALIPALEAKLREEEEQIRQLETAPGELSDLRNDLSRAESRFREAESKFKRKGMTLYQRLEEVTAKLADLKREREACRSELRILADDNLPLVLVRRLLKNLLEDVVSSRADAAARTHRATALETLDALIEWLDGDAEATSDTIGLVTKYRNAQYREVPESDRAPACSELSEATIDRLETLATSPMLESLDRVRSVMTRIQDIDRDIRGLKRARAAVPDEEMLRQFKCAYDEAEKLVAEKTAKIAAAERIKSALEARAQQTRAELNKKLQERERHAHRNEEHDRIIEASRTGGEVLAAFRQGIVVQHVASIKTSIWERFRLLVRKKGLGECVSIDASNYELSVLDQSGSRIPPERLSAGERQLLATAMLWGLADVAKKRLPVVIDTPLGRLDSDHRRNLVEAYFPNVAHQVVLLSTDEEIDGRWLPILEPRLARAYTIEFDDEQSRSRIREGYFKQEVASVA